MHSQEHTALEASVAGCRVVVATDGGRLRLRQDYLMRKTAFHRRRPEDENVMARMLGNRR